MSKTITVTATIIEIGDQVKGNDQPEIYLLQPSGNRIFIHVTREWLIDLVRGSKALKDNETFTVYEEVDVTINISKKSKTQTT